METPCTIHLLGTLSIQGADQTITRFRSQKSAALLAYLAINIDRPHPRERLADMLWPDAEPDAGRRNLRVELAWLRRALDSASQTASSALICDYSTVRLDSTGVCTDVASLCSALGAGDTAASAAERIAWLRQAVETYRGELLPGCYEVWALTERERLATAHLVALKRLSALLEQTGDLDRAVEYAHQAVAADPLDEGSHCQLIRLLAAQNRPAAARAQYEALERLLRDELGVEPSEETAALRSRLDQSGTQGSNHHRRPVPSSSFPMRLTRLIGREAELTHLLALLAPLNGSDGEVAHHPTTRLITLTGPGGIGKTRLAVEVGSRLGTRLPGAVWFVPLADLRRPDEVPGAVGEALGLPHDVTTSPAEQIAEVLSDRRALLILDNLEHLLTDRAEFGDAEGDAAAVVEDLLRRVPGLTCLTTSRQRLGIAGEWEVPIAPLPTPDRSNVCRDAWTLNGLATCDSVRLFVDRARHSRPDFEVTRSNAEAVAALCMRLEGVPLALELAAAWAQTLTPAQMLERLSSGIDLLVTRARHTDRRHQSLRAAMQWSYDLLPAPLRAFFVRLSVFHGSFDLEAVAFVCDQAEPLPWLTELRERSLVVTEEYGREMRFRLLVTVRDFAWGLAREEEQQGLIARHIAFYLRRAEVSEQLLHGADRKAWMERLCADYANLQKALEGSVSGEQGLRLAAALTPFWTARGLLTEGALWLRRALNATDIAAPTAAPVASAPIRAKALFSAAVLAGFQGAEEQSLDLICRGLAIRDTLPDDWNSGEALLPIANPKLLLPFTAILDPLLNRLVPRVDEPDRRAPLDRMERIDNASIRAVLLGSLAKRLQYTGDYGLAEDLLGRSLALYRGNRDAEGIAALQFVRGSVAVLKGNYPEARHYWIESLRLYRRLDDRLGTAKVLGDLAYLACRMAELARAGRLAERALLLHRRNGSRGQVASALWLLGTVALRSGDYGRAEAVLQQSLSIHRDMGSVGLTADALSALGLVALHRGDLARAQSFHEEALVLRRRTEDRVDIALSLLALGDVASHAGDDFAAVPLLEEALALGRERESKPVQAQALSGLGLLAARRGDLVRADEMLSASLAYFRQVGDPVGVAGGLEAVAQLRGIEGRWGSAACLLGAAHAIRAFRSAPLPSCDRMAQDMLADQLRKVLGDAEFEAEWKAGSALQPEQAVERALSRAA